MSATGLLPLLSGVTCWLFEHRQAGGVEVEVRFGAGGVEVEVRFGAVGVESLPADIGICTHLACGCKSSLKM